MKEYLGLLILFIFSFSVRANSEGFHRCQSLFSPEVSKPKVPFSLQLSKKPTPITKTAVKSTTNRKQSKKQQIKGLSQTQMRKVQERVSALALEINSYEQKEITKAFFEVLEKAKTHRKSQASPNWMKEPWAYVYVDLMGGTAAHPGNFNSFIRVLDYYQTLGIKNLYLLPHYESPLQDGGYDVINHKQVRSSLGGNKAFSRFQKEAQRRGFRLMLDFIPGHISEQSPLFQKALSGDLKALEFFLYEEGVVPFKTEIRSSGEKANTYFHSDGSRSERLIIFPDVMKSHYEAYNINGRTVSVYSAFYGFQKDFNNQKADVIKYHLENLLHLIQSGAMGIRADAIIHWIKYRGTSGEELKESYRLAELFHLFVKLVDPNVIFAPEAVVGAEKVAELQGPEVEFFGKKGGSLSDTSFAFEEAMRVKNTFVFKDFSTWFSYNKRKQNLVRREGLTSLIPLHKHDEWELGFVEKEYRENYPQKLFVFKNGFSGGGRLASVLSERQLHSYYKFMLALEGTPMMYYGDEVGVKTSWKYAWERAILLYKKLKSEGKVTEHEQNQIQIELEKLADSPHLKEQPPDEQSLLQKFIDARDLHRGYITPEIIQGALEGQNNTYNFLKKLYTVRNRNSVFVFGGIEKAIETLDSKTVAFIRKTDNESVLVISNTDSSEKTVRLSREALGISASASFFELEQNKYWEINYRQIGDYFELLAPAETTLWLRVDP